MKAYMRIYYLKDNIWNPDKMKVERMESGECYHTQKLGSFNTVKIDNRLSINSKIELAHRLFNSRCSVPSDGFDIVLSDNIRNWDNGKVVYEHNLINPER